MPIFKSNALASLVKALFILQFLSEVEQNSQPSTKNGAKVSKGCYATNPPLVISVVLSVKLNSSVKFAFILKCGGDGKYGYCRVFNFT